MDRQQAVATDGMWSGFARTEAGMVSGWHHHGEYETTIYVVTGALLMEFGPGGSSTVEADPGDFVYVPKGAVHRESNPSAEPADIVVVRAGWVSPRSTSTARRKLEWRRREPAAGWCLRGGVAAAGGTVAQEHHMAGLGTNGTAWQQLLAKRKPGQGTGGLLTLSRPSSPVR
jgi:uncharacterized RmlC-like cupin family protein